MDELGIVLRLADAQEDYKRALNITGRELTKFEKAQAVARDTLTQVNEKYSKSLEILSDNFSMDVFIISNANNKK